MGYIDSWMREKNLCNSHTTRETESVMTLQTFFMLKIGASTSDALRLLTM